eukprot:368001-Ditylum_brightwellii.AAC.1
MVDRRTVEDFSKANKELAEANKQLTSQMEKINDKLDAMTSCGYKDDKKHNSVTCSREKDRHQEAATRSNPMGGSQAGKQQQ